VGKQINKFEGSVLQGVAFGNNNTVNNFVAGEDLELKFFAEQGEKVLEKLEPDQKEYIILNQAVVYAKRKKKREVIKALKQHSLDVWKMIFANVAAPGIIEMIKKWCGY